MAAYLNHRLPAYYYRQGQRKINEDATAGKGPNLSADDAAAIESGADAEGANDVPDVSYPAGTFPVDIPSIPIAPFNFTDPLKVALQTYKQNLGIYDQSYNLATDYARRTLNTEFDINRDYATKATPFIQSLIDNENAYNQGQLTRNLDAGVPGGREALFGVINDAKKYSQGRLITSIEDAAFEYGSRSEAADQAFGAGLGAKSVFGKTVSDKFSAKERLGVAQYGNDLLQRSLQQAFGTFVDQPSKLKTSQQFSAQPSVSPAQLITGQAKEISNLGTIQPDVVSAQKIGQEEFRTSQVQSVFNNRAQLKLAAQEFNSAQKFTDKTNGFQADVFNAQTEEAHDQQTIATQQAQDAFAAQQHAQNVQGVLGTVGTIGGGIAGAILGGPAGAAVGASIGGSLAGAAGGGASSGGGGLSSIVGGLTGQFFSAKAPGGASIPAAGDGTELGAGLQYDGGGFLKSANYTQDFKSNVEPPISTNQYGASKSSAAHPANNPEVQANYKSLGVSPPADNITAPAAQTVRSAYSSYDFDRGGFTQTGFRAEDNGKEGLGLKLIKNPLAEYSDPILNAAKQSPYITNGRNMAGEKTLGISPDAFGKTVAQVAPKLSDLKLSDARNIGTKFDNYNRNLTRASTVEKDKMGIQMMHDMLKFGPEGDSVSDSRTAKDSISEFVNRYDLEGRTIGDLDQGRRVSDYMVQNMRGLGVFNGVEPQDENAYIRAGLAINDLVLRWDEHQPMERLYLQHIAINNLTDAFKGNPNNRKAA